MRGIESVFHILASAKRAELQIQRLSLLEQASKTVSVDINSWWSGWFEICRLASSSPTGRIESAFSPRKFGLIQSLQIYRRLTAVTEVLLSRYDDARTLPSRQHNRLTMLGKVCSQQDTRGVSLRVCTTEIRLKYADYTEFKLEMNPKVLCFKVKITTIRASHSPRTSVVFATPSYLTTEL